MRLFLAIALSSEVRARIVEEQEVLREQLQDWNLKWVAPENLHLTMVFFGEVEEARLDELRSSVSQATSAISVMRVRYWGLGGFPARRPRVIWVGSATDPYEVLPEAMYLLNRACNVPFPESRRLDAHPHVTIARVQSKAAGARSLEEAIRAFRWGEIVSQDVIELTLYHSHLTKQGPRYEVVDVFPLGDQVTRRPGDRAKKGP